MTKKDNAPRSWTDLLSNETHSALLDLFPKLIGKTWFDSWYLHDICYLIRAARHYPLCETCDGEGYQGIKGTPHKSGCDDCAGTGLSLPVRQIGKWGSP